MPPGCHVIEVLSARARLRRWARRLFSRSAVVVSPGACLSSGRGSSIICTSCTCSAPMYQLVASIPIILEKLRDALQYMMPP